jgi:hypothetical protein
VSSKESTFSKEGGHKSQETFFSEFWAEMFFCCGRPYYTDPYSPYDSIHLVQPYRFGMEIEAFQAQISRQIFVFCSLFLGRTKQSVQLTVGMENEAEGGRTTIQFWHEKRG